MDVISLADASFPPASTSSIVDAAAAAGAAATAAFASAPDSPATPSNSVRANSPSLAGAIGAGVADRRHSRRVVVGAMSASQLSLQSWMEGEVAGDMTREPCHGGGGGGHEHLPTC